MKTLFVVLIVGLAAGSARAQDGNLTPEGQRAKESVLLIEDQLIRLGEALVNHYPKWLERDGAEGAAYYFGLNCANNIATMGMNREIGVAYSGKLCVKWLMRAIAGQPIDPSEVGVAMMEVVASRMPDKERVIMEKTIGELRENTN